MDEQKKQPQNQPQNPGNVVREIERPVADYASERGPDISEELRNVGIESVIEKPQIDKINEQMGVKTSLENVSIPVQPSASLILPKVKDLQGEKKKVKLGESRLWEIEKEIREMRKAA